MRTLKRLIFEESGQGMSEYALLLVLFVVAIAALTQLTDIKNALANAFSSTATALEGAS